MDPGAKRSGHGWLWLCSSSSLVTFDLSVSHFPHPQHDGSVRNCLGECQGKMSSYELSLSRAPGIYGHKHSEALLWPCKFQAPGREETQTGLAEECVDHVIHGCFQRGGMGGKEGRKAIAGVMPSLGWTLGWSAEGSRSQTCAQVDHLETYHVPPSCPKGGWKFGGFFFFIHKNRFQ